MPRRPHQNQSKYGWLFNFLEEGGVLSSMGHRLVMGISSHHDKDSITKPYIRYQRSSIFSMTEDAVSRNRVGCLFFASSFYNGNELYHNIASVP